MGDTNKNNWQKWVDDIDWDDNTTVTTIPAAGTIPVTETDLGDGGCTLAVRLVSNGLASGIVTVRFNKIDADRIESIPEFKETYINDSDLPAPGDEFDESNDDIFRYEGYARVINVTPHYLYIRTNMPNDGELSNGELSSHSLLLYNADGWEQGVAGINHIALSDDGEETPPAVVEEARPQLLKKDDIITNFALIPTTSGFGNLIGDATGFIRTFRRVMDMEVGSNTPNEINAQDLRVKAFDESDRMLRYEIKNVKVLRDEITLTGSEGQDSTAYIYTLDIPGKPILNNGDVFEANPDWDVIWSESAMFDLGGVVMLHDADKAEGEDGRYMLALIPDNVGVSGVPTPRAPRIRLEEAPGVKDGRFITKAKVILESNTAEENKNADIFYTTDGTDPRLNTKSRKNYTQTGPFEITKNTVIKAYVRANGTPNSELADTIYTRRDIDTRYIVNFLDAAVENTPYHITATTKVVAKGGEYIFVRGTQGHYLPVHFDEASMEKMPEKGEYLTDFIAEAHIVSLPEGNIVRGAHVIGEYAPLFNGVSKEMPEGMTEDISAEPDEVNTITTANARRYVRINEVSLEGFKMQAQNGHTDTQAAGQWILHTKKGDGERIRVNHDILKPTFDWDAADTAKAV
ncbi:MAG: chitobiase/beta-hexosaminidase C-terminal domain-containing protein, partial [Paramuribaculum sp.]|nr:chitobiase/beta-hexosaminidase C-terminal domain-containing protein [Paramuribaculum sp.]